MATRRVLGGMAVLGLWLVTGVAGADEGDSKRVLVVPPEDIRSGIEPSRGGVPPTDIPETFRSRIHRAIGDTQPTPDILELKSGREIEAYFLQAYGERLVFYVKEDERTYGRHQLMRSVVRAVRYAEFLPRDPSEPVAIRVAEKQPVAKRSALAGTFRGWQDRHTLWTFTFYSESHKPSSWSEDATDFGTFLLTSQRAVADYAGKTRTIGTYALYAPRTVRNAEWVIVLGDIGHSERDRTDHTSWLSSSLPDDTLILRFSQDENRFRLLWSNRSSGAWSALPQVEFHRVRKPARAVEVPPRVVPPRAKKSDTTEVRVPDPAQVQVSRPSLAPAGLTWVRGASVEAETVTLARQRQQRARFTSYRRLPGHRLDGWKRPQARWLR